VTYIVNDNCIRCKYMDCVEVCPVDCFYEGPNILVIHPDECIDCGVCEPECPLEAILPDTDEGAESWVELNREYSEIWPNITGGLNGSTQHFILNGEMEVLRWFEGFVEVLRRQRERRCGIAGSGVSR